jgi:hypothetical protein
MDFVPYITTEITAARLHPLQDFSFPRTHAEYIE